jgi:carbonic anhydrase
MGMLRPIAEQIPSIDVLTQAERQTALERVSIRGSLANLRTFPCVRILEEKGRMRLHGCWFDISTGELWIMDGKTGDFIRPSA